MNEKDLFYLTKYILFLYSGFCEVKLTYLLGIALLGEKLWPHKGSSWRHEESRPAA